MNSLYLRLANNNISKNKNTFIPFGISCGAMIAMFYMLLSITDQIKTGMFYGAESMKMVMVFGVWICGMFSVAVIFYTNSFLMKRRTKELGLYSILGLEKRHIGKILFWEIIIIGIQGLLGGLIGGLVFSKFMFLLLLKMLHLSSALKFGIGVHALITTTILFVGIFALIMLYNFIKIKFIRPIELLRGENVGEKEPKAKWLSAILGVVCLGIGYYISIVTESPLQALSLFFIAVIFVIAGTFLLFMSGSIALLKILKKNKPYYYHKTHFITVSGMMYRMKQNAAGLSNICILSTMVLVVISTTVALYLGIDDEIRVHYPKDVLVTTVYTSEDERDPASEESYDPEDLIQAVKDYSTNYDIKMKNETGYYSVGYVGSFENNVFQDNGYAADATVLAGYSISDYETYLGKSLDLEPLGKGEVYAYSSDNNLAVGDVLTINSEQLVVKGILDKGKLGEDQGYAQVYGNGYVVFVVNSLEELDRIADTVVKESDSQNLDLRKVSYTYSFDLEGKDADKETFSNCLKDVLVGNKIAAVNNVDNIFTMRKEFLGIYSSLFFIGIFIGTLFLLTTVLIIYYKQISEGYDDRKRFRIMEKVGMSTAEVKKVIGNQIVTVFFLPILIAGVHIVFAFGMIRKILAVLGLTNVTLFIGCTIGTVVVFCVIYGIVYSLTAKAYYRIVNTEDANI